MTEKKLTFAVDNNNMDTLLKHEELESKERATAVMNRIMAISNDDLKVIKKTTCKDSKFEPFLN